MLGAARSSLRQLLPADPGQHPAAFSAGDASAAGAAAGLAPSSAPSSGTPARPAPSPADAEAFAGVYRAHAPAVYAAAHRVLGRISDAEDVTQEVFVRYWRDPQRFDPSRGELGGYLRMMARSRALDLWRHNQAAGRARDRLKLVARDEEPRPEDRPPAVVERDEERSAVRAALKRLPPAQREALVLSYWGSLTPEEIADRVGVPFGTARSRMRLGLEKLRRECGPALADATD